MAVSRRDVLRFGAWAATGLGASMALPRAARSAADEPIGLALCIALDYTTIDHDAYAGWSIPVLEGCLPDAKVMSGIALGRGFNVRKLVNRDATIKNVKASITRAAKGK